MKNWKKSIMKIDSTVYAVIKNLESTGLQIVLVVDKNLNFIGTITDGDIRSHILKGINLNQDIKNIVNRKSKVVSEKMNLLFVEKMMNQHSINHIPIIKKKKIVGLHSRKDKVNTQEIPNKFLIMAGGRGKRLSPITNTIPKPLLKFKKKTLLESLLLKAKESGFKNIYISVKYLKQKIINKVGDGKKYGLEITYLHERKALGTAGCIAFLKNKTNLPIIITNCDIISELDYQKLLLFHLKNKNDLTVVVKDHKSTNPFGQIKIHKSKIIDIIEKPISMSFVNGGVYVLNPKIIKLIKKNKYFDMNNLIEMLLNKKKKVAPYPITDKWLDVSNLLKKNYEK